MKKFYTAATFSLLAGAGLFAQGAKETTRLKTTSSEIVVPQQADQRTGQEVVQDLRRGYEAGQYNALLAGLEADYQKAKGEGQLDEFIQMREETPLSEEEHAFSSHWATVAQQFVEERNGQLKAACSDAGDILTCKRVESIATSLSPEQKEALHSLSSLRFKTPEQAVNEDERTLIEIDIASEFKILHLDAQFAAQPSDDRLEKQMVLKMDMLKQMQQAAETFQDEHLKKTVAEASSGLDLWQARHWDLNELRKMKPTTDLDKKIATILSVSKTKESDLYKQEVSKLGK